MSQLDKITVFQYDILVLHAKFNRVVYMTDTFEDLLMQLYNSLKNRIK